MLSKLRSMYKNSVIISEGKQFVSSAFIIPTFYTIKKIITVKSKYYTE